MRFWFGRTTPSTHWTRLAVAVLVVGLVVVASAKPRTLAPEAAQLPKPYFSTQQSYFTRGNFINLDEETTVADSTELAELRAPEQLWTVAGTNTVSLNWNRAPQAAAYEVRYRPVTQAAFQSAEVTAPFFTVRNAKADTTYEFTVASKDADGIVSKPSASTAVTPTALTSTTKIERHPFEIGAWLPPGWENQNVQASFERGSSTLTSINPFWYNFSTAGKLEAKGSARNPEVVARAHQAGMRVVVTITNNFDATRVTTFLKDPELQQKFIADVVSELAQYDYDGVDLDFENLTPSDRDGFTSFVLALSDAVHAKDKTLELSAQPKKSDGDDWAGPGALDLDRLKDAVDVFKPMLYDFNRPNTEPGPLAPLSWMREVLTYWKAKVGAEKIQAALPLYGYDWSLTTEDDIGIQYEDVQHIKSKYQTTETLDTSSGEIKLSYSDEHGPRTVFYQNASTVQQKVSAVRSLGIPGVTFWLLGGEDPKAFRALQSLTTSTKVTLQKPLNVGLKLKGAELSVSLSKFPEIDHVTVLYGAAPNTLTQKIEKQTTSLIDLPDLRPGETRYIQAVAYDKKGNEIRKSGIAYISAASVD